MDMGTGRMRPLTEADRPGNGKHDDDVSSDLTALSPRDIATAPRNCGTHDCATVRRLLV